MRSTPSLSVWSPEAGTSSNSAMNSSARLRISAMSSAVMTSQDTGGVGLPGGGGSCFGLLEGVGPVAVVAAVVVWVHCTRVGCYWTRVGGTGGRWGLRAVRTTLGQ